MAENITCMAQGRLVFVIGDIFKGTKALQFKTQIPRLNKAGQEYQEYGFGLAVPKSAMQQTGKDQPGEIWAKIHEAAFTLFPNRQIPAAFKMKWKDGDTGVNEDGTPLNTKAGYPGHIVFTCKTTLPPKFFKWDAKLGSNVVVNEGIQCGDYVNVQIGIDVNPGVNSGLYLNPYAVQFLGHGEPISNAPSAASIFGSQAPPLPPGASATPLGAQVLPMPQAVYQGPAMPPGPTGYAQSPQGAQVQQAVAPNWGVLPPVHQPAQVSPQAAGYPPLPTFPQPVR